MPDLSSRSLPESGSGVKAQCLTTYTTYRQLARRWTDTALTANAESYAANAALVGAMDSPLRQRWAHCYREAVRAIEDEQLARAYERAHPEEV